MQTAPARTVGKTPAMAFVLDYLREFPGAEYVRVKKAAQTAGMGVPAPVIYGNALRVIKKEAAREANGGVAEKPQAARGRRGRARAARGVHDLAGLVDQMRDVVEERDRLRAATDQILAVIREMRG
jgi:hypothetical protein